MSHSSRVRGLKFIRHTVLDCEGHVALFTSAWVEILTVATTCPVTWSHSSRVRGLKLRSYLTTLKKRIVALFTSAWVEIKEDYEEVYFGTVALFTSAWVEILFDGDTDPFA